MVDRGLDYIISDFEFRISKLEDLLIKQPETIVKVEQEVDYKPVSPLRFKTTGQIRKKLEEADRRRKHDVPI